MFFQGTHRDLVNSIEAIGAGFAVFEYVPESNNFNLISCNTLYEDVLGIPKEGVLNQSLTAIFPRFIHQPLSESFQKCKSEKIAIETEMLIEYKAIERYWRSIISPVTEVKGGTPRIIQTCVEITEKKLLEKQLNLSMKRFEAVVESAYDGIITIDEQHDVRLINEAAIQIFGYSREEVIGQPLTQLLPHKYRSGHPGYVNGFKKSQIASRPMQTRAAVRGLRKDGSEFPIEVTISKIHVAGNVEMTALVRDVSEKNRLMEELLIASRRDHLTKLFNRRHVSELINNEIMRLARFKHGFALLMIDIDNFKNINDSFGHECGDIALFNFSKLLLENVRATDIASRWGGEEFLILLPETDLASGYHVAEKIRLAAEASSFEYGSQVIKHTVSIGVQYLNKENEKQKLDSMINTVDQCLYSAKAAGRNCVSSQPKTPK